MLVTPLVVVGDVGAALAARGGCTRWLRFVDVFDVAAFCESPVNR